ncbi:antibiotic biosynthesis monooxygenase family protein [Solimonas marina]|uniref:Antibiotic biosynthesis monooxygenase n=1 Tax=Solimonas marina TaxID=2714601 RepID=A0A969W6W7_9GAMM|nr:antibiotic biosynthesis monooxygenase family protein [Solimonas marina]NKF21776.1 antibiotic biosynthesis monooxygenase [Solimonas marina]
MSAVIASPLLPPLLSPATPAAAAAAEPLFIVVSEFAVDPAHQQAFIDDMAAAVERHYRPQPGFVAAKLYASDDGGRLVIDAQWRSEAAWTQVFRNDDVPPPTREIVHRYGAQPQNYRLAHRIGG